MFGGVWVWEDLYQQPQSWCQLNWTQLNWTELYCIILDWWRQNYNIFDLSATISNLHVLFVSQVRGFQLCSACGAAFSHHFSERRLRRPIFSIFS